MEITKKEKEILRKSLEQSFYTFLCFDQKANLKYESPFPYNKDYYERVKKDAKGLADLAIRDIELIFQTLG